MSFYRRVARGKQRRRVIKSLVSNDRLCFLAINIQYMSLLTKTKLQASVLLSNSTAHV